MKLTANEYYIRNICNRLSTILNLPYDVVRAVVDGIPLCILEDLKNRGREDLESGEYKESKLEIPSIGTITLRIAKYPDKDDSYFNGRAFKPKFSIDEKFLMKCRKAYYGQENFLLDTMTKNFKGHLEDHYTSLVKGDDDFE